MKVTPVHNRVIVRPDAADDKTKGGVIIPDSIKERPARGTVVAVGPGMYQEGVFVPTVVKAGDVVRYAKFSGAEIDVDGEDLLIMRETDILATV